MEVRDKSLIFCNPLTEEEEISEAMASFRSGWIGTGPNFPNAEWISERIASLPLSPKLSDEDVADVIAAVRGILG